MTAFIVRGGGAGAAAAKRPMLAWGMAARPIPGERCSGDHGMVVEAAGGTLVAVMDGLGHGAAAHEAAEAAARSLRAGVGAPLSELVMNCHGALHKTRGVALSLAFFDSGKNVMTWMGVGNVEGVLLRPAGGAGPARESLLLRGGVVGYRLPPLQVATLPVFAEDTLIFATDGIRSQFSSEQPAAGSPQAIAEALLARFWRGTDDALVLVARYLRAAS